MFRGILFLFWVLPYSLLVWKLCLFSLSTSSYFLYWLNRENKKCKYGTHMNVSWLMLDKRRLLFYYYSFEVRRFSSGSVGLVFQQRDYHHRKKNRNNILFHDISITIEYLLESLLIVSIRPRRSPCSTYFMFIQQDKQSITEDWSVFFC